MILLERRTINLTLKGVNKNECVPSWATLCYFPAEHLFAQISLEGCQLWKIDEIF